MDEGGPSLVHELRCLHGRMPRGRHSTTTIPVRSSISCRRDDDAIEALLKSDTIWYCGSACRAARAVPRGNTRGVSIQALRTLSQKLGFFVESEKGRQQLAP